MADIDRLLTQLGPMSAENASRARAFYGANPDQLERKLAGLKGGSGQGGAGDIDLMLDQVVKDTAPAPQKLSPPSPEISSGMTYNAPQQAPAVAPKQGMPTRSDSSHGPVDTSNVTIGGPSFGDWLLSLLGASSGVGMATMAGLRKPAAQGVGSEVGGAIAPEVKRLTYQPKLENQGPTEVRNSPDLEAKGQARVENDMRVRADVADENAANDALMRQIIARQQAQRQTQQTIDAAKRTVGRR